MIFRFCNLSKAIFFCWLIVLGHVSGNENDQRLEKLRLDLKCSALRPAQAISERLRDKPDLYLCYRGREMENQRRSYVEFSSGKWKEFATLPSFAARFAPFDTEPTATALALAFTHAKPDLHLENARDLTLIKVPHKGALVSPSGNGHRVVLYEETPVQGQCEVPGINELVIQTWPDGMKREIRRTKIYERADQRKICVD